MGTLKVFSKTLVIALTMGICFSVTHARAQVQSNSLSLSAGVPPPLTVTNMMVNNAGPGGAAAGATPDTSTFLANANMGDLSQVTNGLPAQAVLGLRIKGNVPFQVLMAQIFYNANNLQYRGVDISGSRDRGSFIHVIVGTPIAVTQNANVAGTTVNPAMTGDGLTLNQVSFGSLIPSASTQVIFGASPTITKDNSFTIPGLNTNTLGTPGATSNMTSNTTPNATTGSTAGQTLGNTTSNTNSATTSATTTGTTPAQSIFSTNNTNSSAQTLGAIDIPLYFLFPTGLALGPTTVGSPGTFSTQLQFGIFPRP